METEFTGLKTSIYTVYVHQSGELGGTLTIRRQPKNSMYHLQEAEEEGRSNWEM